MALAAIALAACDNEEIAQSTGHFPEDSVIRVTTEVSDTRAGVTTDNITEFRISVTNPTSQTYSYINVCMTKINGEWTPSTQMLWMNATAPVTIMAYAPCNVNMAGAPNINVLADQSTADNVKASDFVFKYQKDFEPFNDLTTDGKIKIDLAHMLSKLELRVILGNEFNAASIPTNNPISNPSIGGTKLKGTMPSSTTVAPDGTDNDAASIAPFFAKYTPATGATSNCIAEYEAILIPQTVAANGFVVKFKLGGKEYQWKATSAIELNCGKKYTLDLTVGKDVVSMSNVTVADWGTTDNTIDEGTERMYFLDPNFVTVLSSDAYNVPLTNGIIDPTDPTTKTALENITTLNVNRKGITSLEGIQYLSNLINLQCDNNQLTTLDVTGLSNLFLDMLFCGNQKDAEGNDQELTLTIGGNAAGTSFKSVNNPNVTVRGTN